MHGGINDFIVIDAKHVAADALRVIRRQKSVRNTEDTAFLDHDESVLGFYLAIVVLLPLVSENRADDSPRILDHHLSSINVSFAKQTSAMDG